MLNSRKSREPGLILASASPRRQELLKLCGEPFRIMTARVDETAITDGIMKTNSGLPFQHRAEQIVTELAAVKAGAILALHPEAVVIGADTIVTIDEDILGKPESPEDAMKMLRRLCGQQHQVFTGVSIQSKAREDTFFTLTLVRFFPWDEKMEEIVKQYVSTGSPMDKAGAYGIQDMGALLVSDIQGDFYTVMGFPIAQVCRRLSAFL